MQNLTLYRAAGQNESGTAFSKSMEIDGSTLRRFWSKVNKKGPTADHMDSRCWEWSGGRNKDGYGRFSVRGKELLAHRFSFWLSSGESPEVVMHKCNNPACVRPNHLAAGDCHDNLIDILVRRVREGRRIA